MRAIPVDPAAVRPVFVDVAPVREYGPDDNLLPDSHKADNDGRLLYNVTALVKVAGENGGETIRVRVPFDKEPALEEFTPISFAELRAMPWSRGDRSGVSYFASAVSNSNGTGRGQHKPPASAEG